MTAPGSPTRVLPRAQTFAGLALASAAAIPVVLLLGRAPRPRNAAVVAMMIGVVISLGWQRGATRAQAHPRRPGVQFHGASAVPRRGGVDEAESMRRVDSQYVARVFEVASFDEGLPFIAMELVEGRSLSEVLRERERLSFEEARRLIRDMARGLADVHAAGVLHCDIKPGNVLHTEAGRWKLVDFGVARRLDSALGRTAQAGTPAYMAPEQATGGEVDERSDLYALCLVAYGALVGRPAFVGSRGTSRDTGDRVPPDTARWIELPEDLRLALRRGLANRPQERYQGAAELAIAFEAAFDGRLPRETRRLAAQLSWTYSLSSAASLRRRQRVRAPRRRWRRCARSRPERWQVRG